MGDAEEHPDDVCVFPVIKPRLTGAQIKLSQPKARVERLIQQQWNRRKKGLVAGISSFSHLVRIARNASWLVSTPEAHSSEPGYFHRAHSNT